MRRVDWSPRPVSPELPAQYRWPTDRRIEKPKSDRTSWEVSDRPTIQALVTTFNVEHCVGACLDSLSWCDSILVVDSYSTDATVEVARSSERVEVLEHAYYGGASQKNWALQRVDAHWVLILDSDEVCTPELRREIQELLAAGPDHDIYRIRRRLYLLGRWVRFSGCRRDYVARLFKPERHRYQDRRVHARIPSECEAPILESSMDHFMADSVAEVVERLSRYAYWGAAQAYREGRRSSLIGVLVRPTYRFIRTFLLQGGFLDGMRGLLFTLVQAMGSFQKAAILLGWQVNERRGVHPIDLPKFEDGYERTVAGPAPVARPAGWSRRPAAAEAPEGVAAINE